MPKSSRTYHYEGLEFPNQQIRILRLLPKDDIGRISCSLETCTLRDQPFYVAVSYEWGEYDPDIQVEIVVDGRRAFISHNLWLFLDFFRDHKKSLVEHAQSRLWIDALCIDQKNLEEKKFQVGLMNRIYQQADHVYAWLGWTTAIETQATFNFIQAVPQYHEDRSVIEDATISVDRALDATEDEAGVYELRIVDLWTAMLRFCNLSYWSRRWVIQELIFARNITLLCDDSELNWKSLAQAFDFVTKIDSQLKLRSLFVSSAAAARVWTVIEDLQLTVTWKIYGHRMRTLEQPREETDEISRIRHARILEKLLDDFASTSCLVLHDRVYALANIAFQHSPITTDYTCTPLQLFFRLLAHTDGPDYADQWPVKLARYLELDLTDPRFVWRERRIVVQQKTLSQDLCRITVRPGCVTKYETGSGFLEHINGMFQSFASQHNRCWIEIPKRVLYIIVRGHKYPEVIPDTDKVQISANYHLGLARFPRARIETVLIQLENGRITFGIGYCETGDFVFPTGIAETALIVRVKSSGIFFVGFALSPPVEGFAQDVLLKYFNSEQAELCQQETGFQDQVPFGRLDALGDDGHLCVSVQLDPRLCGRIEDIDQKIKSSWSVGLPVLGSGRERGKDATE